MVKLESESINKLKIAMAAVSGLMLTGAFPNIDLNWLAWCALVPLLIAIQNLNWRDRIRIGLIAGLVHYLTLMYWLQYTMQIYGHLPWYLSIPVLFLMATYLSLYVIAFVLLVDRLHEKPALCLILIPALWVSLEYIRSFLFTGFPWELLGYSQYRTLHIIQISDIFGVFGISFLILLTNVALYQVYLYFTANDRSTFPVTRRGIIGAGIAVVMVLAAAWAYGAFRIKTIDHLAGKSAKERIGVVQGNIEQSLKWDPAFQVETIHKYTRLSRVAGEQKPKLIVWPETATPFYFLYDKKLSDMVLEGIRPIATHFLIGSPSFNQKDKQIDYFNSAYLVRPDGKAIGKYDKAHLVPYGEYVPLRSWFPFLGKMVAQVGDFVPGKKGETLTWNDYKLGVLICYELIFPYLSRAVTKNGAAVLVNITNDAWYGRTSAPYQHFSMAVLRAVENRRSLVRAANTGISGFIDPVGRVTDATELFTEATLTRDVPFLTSVTFYTRYGEVFARLCLAISLFAIFIKMLTFKKHTKRR